MNIRPSILLLALLAAGCASTQGGPAASGVADSKVAVGGAPGPSQPVAAAAAPVAPSPAPAASAPKEQAQKNASSSTKLYPGNDQFFKRDKAPAIDPVLAKGDKVALNFENVTVSNLATALLGDLLKLNYTIDAGGETVVSLHTRQPLLRSQVLDVLDAVLLPHDLAIVRDNAGVYHVTKRTVTVGARPVVGASKFKDLSGAGTVIVPLNHIAAAEMAKILAPIAPREAIVYVDSLRNLLVLQGSKAQLGGWLEMVEAFDVDFLSGMSLGVFVLENANVNVVRDALQAMLGSDKSSDPYGGAGAAPAGGAPSTSGAAAGGAAATGGASGAGAQMATPLGGLIRVFPVERLNALVVVTPRSHLLAQVETWIRRLDRPTDTLEASLFVYPVQNGSALQLAEMLNGLFGGQSGQTGSGGVAAGSAPTQFSRGAGGSGLGTGSTGNTGSSSGLYGNSSSSGTGTGSSPMNAALGAGGNRTSSNNTSLTSTSQLDGNVRVVADEKRNALLIRAPRTEYRRIEQALRELDRAPMQVLIEASIVEVSLTGNLEYGVEWYLQNGLSRGRQGGALLDLDTSGIGPKVPGFSYTISKADVVRATLNAVATKNQVRLLSSPSLLVLNNHTANIQVGDQQPILTSTAAATGSNFITQSITYKDTGVLLSVTPSVNAGGLISMDISQQVTDVGERDVVTSQRSFQTRQIQTRVAVRSGESIVLGGLIRENDTNSRAGLPGLADVPLLGALFSNTKNDRNRTELLVLMTPRALEDDDQLRSASAEMRERMRSLSLQAQPMSFRPPDVQLQPSR